jgi:hypothetical protein
VSDFFGSWIFGVWDVKVARMGSVVTGMLAGDFA